jgi:citrate lyase subunit beta/citryl-CoA lyase
VRVNRPWRLLVRDLEAIVRASVLAIALPKIPDASFVLSVSEVLADLERERGLSQGHTRIVGMVEDAEGLSNMNEIASANSRMVGLIVGAEDLAVSMRMAVDDDGLYVPNVLGVAAARRAGILPVGFIGSVADFKDTDAFRARIRRARRLGFESAFCVHPTQVPIINEEFAPTAAEVAYATGLIAEFEREVSGGRAAFTYQGRMVDLPIVDQARLVLARHRAIVARAGRA